MAKQQLQWKLLQHWFSMLTLAGRVRLVPLLSWETQGPDFLHSLKQPTEGASSAAHTQESWCGRWREGEEQQIVALLAGFYFWFCWIVPEWFTLVAGGCTLFCPEMHFLLLCVDTGVSGILGCYTLNSFTSSVLLDCFPLHPRLSVDLHRKKREHGDSTVE